MKEYTVVYTSGRTEEVEYPDKETLIREHFGNSVKRFRNEVSRLMWNTLSIQYVEDVQNESNFAQITSADVNPYGWRG